MLWSVTSWTVKCSKFPCLGVGWTAQELLWLCCAHWRRDPHRNKMGTTLLFGHWIRVLTSQTGSPQRCQQIQLYKLSRSTQSHSLIQFHMSRTTKCPEIFARFLTCGRLLDNCQSAMNATRATRAVENVNFFKVQQLIRRARRQQKVDFTCSVKVHFFIQLFKNIRFRQILKAS